MKTDDLLKALSTQKIDDVLTLAADDTFVDYLNRLIDESGIKKSELFRHAQIERSYGYQIIKGRRLPSRDKVIALALSLSLDLEKTNRLLKLSDHSVLYPQVPRDAVIIYCLIHHADVIQTNETLSRYQYPILNEERG